MSQDGNDAVPIAEMGFEQAYRALEETVAALERGELSLDDTMALYERGIALADRCSEVLTAAEMRVRQLDEDGQDAGPLEL